MAVVVAMAEGAVYKGEPILVKALEEAIINAKKKKKLLAKAGYLKDEIKQQSELKLIRHRKCSNWTNPKCQEWLGQNPITDDVELEWISHKVKEVHASLDAALQEALVIDSNQKKKKPNWDFISWLHYIHCLTDESLRELFFQSTASLTRAELDAGKIISTIPPASTKVL